MPTLAITVKRDGRNYFAYCKILPGVYGIGASVNATRKNISEAISLYRAYKAQESHLKPGRRA
jgi:predicted RNase H-like HicB family nuclease